MNKKSLGDAVRLPCGVLLKNRFVKAAMSDSLGNGAGDATRDQARLYEKWAEGGVALSIIGEVQGDFRYPEKPGNLVLNEDSDLGTLRDLTSRASINDTHVWAQIGHAGALSDPLISNPAGPSELSFDELKCRALSLEEVRALPEQFAKTALIAKSAGFTGVQIHAAHGFLLSQFLSPLFNHREDEYGGSITCRSRIVLEVIKAVRAAVGSEYPIGIKINSSDLLEGGLVEDEALELVALLNASSIDLIDISGGTYFPGAKASSDASANGPYFLKFAQQARKQTRIPLMLTGGFKTRDQALSALEEADIDFVGLARAMIISPSLPNTWLEQGEDPVFPRFTSTQPGGVTAWYTMAMTALAKDDSQTFDTQLQAALQTYEKRDALRRDTWRKKFTR
ncbi:NADH:flavin oxidoreductase/NADH oxidase family protein [Marinomonas sp. C2222]|uniref:NADH:flavin oxidoreductase/NADH oxidase family protein n=1 Tax=Marinomonas sargassi TaxID=2984494 RepID=A0ABT2YRR6_9GAMM|nr:NADH:flavin oxidoreductase/NADH oxidase family protein [Marinomonas sargassi]MCV2402588.1 NADH:flavin oxidoreductase/NADH oxidase family protein [Marinomonas sargassi]